MLEIDELLLRRGGVLRRSDLIEIAGRNWVDNEVRRGRLVVPFRSTVCRPWDVDVLRDRAALVSVGAPVAVSHRSALRRWGLDPGPGPLELAVLLPRNPRRPDGVLIHRLVRWPPVHRVDKLPTIGLADSLVMSWSQVDHDVRRGLAIRAVRGRATTPPAVTAALARHPRAAERVDLARLMTLLADGCESELEIWGHLAVFNVPGLEHAVRQQVVTANGNRFRLDLAYEAERVAVELDGHAFHSTREQRERDMRRDAALASIGWLTLRFSHRRLHADVAGCRRETLATLAARRPIGRH